MTSRNYRLSPERVDADYKAINAVANMPDYAPLQNDLEVENLAALRNAIEQHRLEMQRINDLLNSTRHKLQAAEWQLHDAMLRVKDHVIVQYGADSPQVETLGLKKRSERRRPVRKVYITAAE